MKIQLESIAPNINRSFSLLYNPRLSDLFFRHFHPELELVYIEGATGTRHVGDHISIYEESDLVLIGSNIPHLNFDYGVDTDYQKVVIHIQPSFVEKNIHDTPELASISRLLERAKHGIAFDGAIKREVGKKLLAFNEKNAFGQYLELLIILKLLSDAESSTLLHEQVYMLSSRKVEHERMRTVYTFIDQHYHQKIELGEVAILGNMTKEAFCRYFKKTTGKTFVEFLNQYRINQSKRLLMNGKSVSEACYSSGFESLSYFNRIFKRITKENPSTFRKKYS